MKDSAAGKMMDLKRPRERFLEGNLVERFQTTEESCRDGGKRRTEKINPFKPFIFLAFRVIRDK
jgi:hypothetical protein